MRRRSFVQMMGGLFGGGAAVKAGIVTAMPVAPSVAPSALAGMGSMFMGDAENSVVGIAQQVEKPTFLQKVAYEISHLTKRAAKHQVLKSTGVVPAWIKQDIIEEYDDDYVERRLPPHIMSFKSVSHASKVRMARDYYVKKRIDHWYDGPTNALSVLMQRQLDPEISRSMEGGYCGPMVEDEELEEHNKKRLRYRGY